ncbi:hypothetical protein ACGFNU_21725 [Spirillospora sp. NPDC048911]|uniref:hypothetical protein n=1 Tax=Spirillospora sp. NPDC048911 TaxID=3364527 RepID=UPI003720B87F
MSGVESAAWYRPGMPDREVQEWLAAERAAALAPEIAPTDDIALSLRALFPDFPSWLAAHRAEQVQDPAA